MNDRYHAGGRGKGHATPPKTKSTDRPRVGYDSRFLAALFLFLNETKGQNIFGIILKNLPSTEP